MAATPRVEDDRRAQLVAAERRASQLFDAIERSGIVRAHRSERAIEDDIYELAKRELGIEKHWHKRIVRTGINALTTALESPPVRDTEADDLVYVDLGPVFGEWEADMGRTYALGNDPRKRALVADLSRVFERVQAHYVAHEDITGAQLYAFAQRAGSEAGWIFGGEIAGHLISEYPHAQIPGDRRFKKIDPQNTRPMREPDELGRVRHWILEIHLIDPARTYGGFYERLL